jgi:hypothetical protein
VGFNHRGRDKYSPFFIACFKRYCSPLLSTIKRLLVGVFEKNRMRLSGRKISCILDSPHNQSIILKLSIKNINLPLEKAIKKLAKAVNYCTGQHFFCFPVLKIGKYCRL